MSDRAVEPLDLSTERRIHIIAIGGAGMSAIATILAAQGHVVTGSDMSDSPRLHELSDSGIRTVVGHSAENVGSAEFVLKSTAVRPDNPEVLGARSRGLRVLSRIEFLPSLASRQPFVSISGTHGKTTTTSMVAVALDSVGAAPSFLVGAKVHSLGASAGYGAGEMLVLEADESDGSFLAGPRAGALVTNVEADHLDFWGGLEQLTQGFRRFLDDTDGPRVVCIDDGVLAGLGPESGATGYGFSSDADFRIVGFEQRDGQSRVEVKTPVGRVTIELAVPGRHNALNAVGALALVSELGNDVHEVAAGLGRYRGVSRRFERRGSLGGVDFIDDYAHHPTELRAALAAASAGGWNRLIVVFQPHRYSRTEALWGDFTRAFAGADALVVTDIYAAGESPIPGVTGRALAEAIGSTGPDQAVRWLPSLGEAARHVLDIAQEGDVVLSLGAGDITTLADLAASIVAGG